jgi:hypothetical protein
MEKLLFAVYRGKSVFVCWAHSREEAKNQAYSWFGGDRDQYIVSPISSPGHSVHIGITLYV